jgi:hypothetical protein
MLNGGCMDENKEKLLAIKDLMDELIGDMGDSAEDFDMRLGKPKVEAVSMEMGDDVKDDPLAMDGDMPEDDLEKRIMKLRG